MLDPFAQLFQHYWGHARALHMVSKLLWVASFPTLMGVLSSVFTLLPTRTQQLPALLVQQWKLLRPFARSFMPTMHSVGQPRNYCNRLPLYNRSEFWTHLCLRFCVSHTAAETWRIWDNLRESFSHIFVDGEGQTREKANCVFAHLQ